jgi:hypothetical protein
MPLLFEIGKNEFTKKYDQSTLPNQVNTILCNADNALFVQTANCLFEYFFADF